MSVNIIVAVGNPTNDRDFPIGKKGGMPWHNKADLKWFKNMTTGHPVIMGRKTYESIGHPLPNRTNIVISSNNDLWSENSGIRVYDSIENAINFAKTIDDEIFIIGGESIYDYALEHELVDKIYLDWIDENVPDADSFFPDIVCDENWTQEGTSKEIEKNNAYAFTYVKLKGKNNHVDEQYFNLIEDIIEHGEVKDTRAGKARSVFGRQMRFNLKEGLPILTTKKVYTKGVIHELLWFLKGDTNINYLVKNNVHIWDDDAYRYYLELIEKQKKLDNERIEELKHRYIDFENFLYERNKAVENVCTKEEFISKVQNVESEWFLDDNLSFFLYTYGDLGSVYGEQWTDWNGINQIENVINTLKTNPDDRRMIVSAWNVGQLKDMALPPCHYTMQFYTKKMTLEERIKWFEKNVGPYEYNENYELLNEWNVPTRKLNCMFNMRSNDIGSGTSFNWASYAILTHIIAQCCNMDVDELIYVVGDAHIYENHIALLKEQLNRNPYRYALPKLWLNPNITEFDKFEFEDIKIEGYKSYPPIKLPLNVGL